ncbi:DMT family transporter [Tundrisphaera sp. TA3]|uniref:DMT family transporter n=1 Tax=Tundrisphaera sp. TA3 TaxID=3435775 RepID=UPI003EC0B8D3
MNDPAPRPGRIDHASAWMLFGAISFATMGAFVHALGDRCDWLLVAAVRALIMLATALVLARASGTKLAIWRPRSLWIRSLAGSFSLVCNFYALAHLPVADAITLFNVHPLWIVLLPSFVKRRLPTPAESIGVTCGLAGVFLIQRPELGGDRLAVMVSLLSSLSTATAMLGLNRLKGVDARAVVVHFAGVASLFSIAWMALRWRSVSLAGLYDPATLALLLGAGASGTLAQVSLTKAYASGSPAKVAVVGLSQVVFGMGFDVVLWHRALTPTTLAGFALVMAPATWLSARSAPRWRPRPAPAPADVPPAMARPASLPLESAAAQPG